MNSADEPVADETETPCCVVGGGPAGVMLSLLLARKGVPVLLIESHLDFDRDFRGDTIHPATLEVLDQLGLADRLLQIPHGKVRHFQLVTSDRVYTLADFGRLRTKFPYIAMLPQAQFLDFLAAEARRYPSFKLVMGGTVQRLVEENGTVRGVRYRDTENLWHEVRAPLTIAADGRFSKLRGLAGIEPVRNAPPMDVVWIRLPRRPTDAFDHGAIYVHGGHFAVVLDRADEWQIGYAILKGSYQQFRSQGVGAMQEALAHMVPWLKDRVHLLEDWKQMTVLSVESSRVGKWFKPGLLLIGDAAHVMSPVGGVGINYAIQDAVETANILGEALKKGVVSESDLAAVQSQRERPTRAIQAFQAQMQKTIAGPALQEGKPFRLPWYARLLVRAPIVRNLPARMVAFGIRRVRVADA